MEIFKRIISVLAYVSVFISITEVYLKVNKLWSRKHEEAVAESVSVTAEFMSLIPGVIYSLNYVF